MKTALASFFKAWATVAQSILLLCVAAVGAGFIGLPAQGACSLVPPGLVAWWQAEGSASDAQGTNATTLSGGVTYAAGKVGQAFNLDGINDAVVIPASSNLNVKSLTIEGWINPVNPATPQPLADFTSPGGRVGSHWFIGYPTSGALTANLRDTSLGDHFINTSSGAVPPNRWSHVALTYDQNSGKANIYLNGTNIVSANLGTFTPLTANNLNLGYRPANLDSPSDQFYRGMLDEFALYNRALSSNEIMAIYAADSVGKCGQLTPPAIMSTTTNMVVILNSAVTLTPVVTGGWPLFFQWALDGTNLVGATNLQLSIPIVNPADEGTYSLVASNALGTVTGTVATLSIIWPPTILSFPTNLVVGYGQPVTLQTTVDGTPPLSLQWQFNGTPVNNATNEQLVIPSASLANEGEYSLVVSNAAGTASAMIASLTVQTPPTITSITTNMEVLAWNPVTLRVSASGSAPLTFQWRLDGTDLPSANQEQLYIAAVTLAQTGEYSVIVSNSFGVVTGIVANLAIKLVNCLPPPNGIVAWWPAEMTALDFAGTNNANLSGITFVEGKIGYAFGFNGTNSTVTIPGNTNLNVKSLTLEGWINPANPAAAQPLADFTSPGGRVGSHLFVGYPGSGALTANLRDTSLGNHSIYSPSGVVPPNRWSHVAVTYDQNSGKANIYLNGTNIASANLGTFTPQTANNLNFGYRPANRDTSADQFYRGMLDEFALYNRALSSNEIMAIYAADYAGKCGRQIPPSLTSVSNNIVAGLGESFTLSATVSGTPPFSFQWLSDDTAIPEGTNSTLTIPEASLEDAGAYHIIVSNAFGITTGLVAQVSVINLPPVITTQPVSQTVMLGNNATFSVVASGTPPKSYQWFMDSAPLADATNATLNLSAVSLASMGAYSVVVSNAVGTAISSNALLSLFDLSAGLFDSFEPDLDSNQWTAFGGLVRATNYGGYVSPPNSLWFSGTGSRFATTRSINTSSGGFASFQLRLGDSSSSNWERVDLPGEGIVFEFATNGTNWIQLGLYDTTNYFAWTTVDVVLPEAAQGPSTYFRWRQLSNSGNTSDVWALDDVMIATGPTPPAITASPTNQMAYVGNEATFVVRASGSSPLSYQWLFNGASLPNETNAALVLTSLTLEQSGAYSVLVSNSLGSVTSSVATLLVQLPPAQIMVAGDSVGSGWTVTVPILLIGNGDENALSFSLSYNRSQVTLLDLSPGSNALAATWFTNSSQLANGRLGISLALPAGQSFPAGISEVARITFSTKLTTNTIVSPLNLVGEPTMRQVSGVLATILPATYLDGSITILPAEYEADVAPRGANDRTLTVVDWVQVGRFVAGLDIVTNDLELQRADCAPRSESGNGILSVTDWVQAGRYSAGLDPLQVASGPTAPIIEGLVRQSLDPQYGAGNACTVSVAEASLRLGQTNRLTVMLTAQGTACALGFSLNYDPDQLTFVGGTLAQGAGAQLNFNTNATVLGQLGVLVSLSAGNSYAPGEQQVVQLDFLAAPTVRGEVSLNFGDTPIAREVSDVQANTQTATWAGRSLAVTLPPVQISSDGGSGRILKFIWPESAGNTVLEASDSLTSPNWAPVPVPPPPVNGIFELSLPADGKQRYYRLKTQ